METAAAWGQGIAAGVSMAAAEVGRVGIAAAKNGFIASGMAAIWWATGLEVPNMGHINQFQWNFF